MHVFIDGTFQRSGTLARGIRNGNNNTSYGNRILKIEEISLMYEIEKYASRVFVYRFNFNNLRTVRR